MTTSTANGAAALVTGAGNGIGQVTANELLSNGFRALLLFPWVFLVRLNGRTPLPV